MPDKRAVLAEIGIDIGGTFTDVVCRLPNGVINTVKIPTTHANPEAAVTQALQQITGKWGIAARDIGRLSHGTTLATNAVIERKGARIGLITTQGFRDVLELGRQFRRSPYEVEPAPEAPVFLIPRYLRKEVPERIGCKGDVIVPLDEAALRTCAQELVGEGVEAIAVCFLFSFMNPHHEKRARDIIAREWPELMVSLSHEVDPTFREYERTCVTAFDSYLKPVLDIYLGKLEHNLHSAGLSAPLQVMLSRGGKCSSSTARQRPVRLFLSGPAAGVIGASTTGKMAGFADLITFDMGGTSCDVALVAEGVPMISAEGEIAGYPVRVPLVDVNTVGAGGGSIAWVDGAGTLRVGPHSAGSEPGPACYGRGGEEPTVTDASIVLGYLNPKNFAGGALVLEADRSHRAIAEKIAAPLRMTVEEAARGIHRVVNAQMAEAIRSVSVYRGYDPRRFSLLPFGGAGPVHAIAVASELGIGRIVVPPRPGVLAACGLLVAPIEHEASMAFLRPFGGVPFAEVRSALDALDRRCAALMESETVDPSTIKINHFADVCYLGQSYYLEVPLDSGNADKALDALYRDFKTLHGRVYGHSTDSQATIVNLRAIHRVAATITLDGAGRESGKEPKSARERRILPYQASTFIEAAVHDREAVMPGRAVEGPAIIEQADTTTVVQPGWRAVADAHGNLIIEPT